VAENATQEVPRFDVDLIVTGVAILRLAVDRDGSVRRDGNAIKKLLKVRTMVFVITEGNAWRSVGVSNGRLAGVIAREGNRCRILMEFTHVDVERANGMEY
jgi:hypothetical protein